ncbi:MAG: hypothetical protein QM750_17775 [Rubrivivax sp.]
MRRAPSVPGWRAAALRVALALATAAAAAPAAEAARIQRSEAVISLSPGRSVLSTYVDAPSGTVVLHLQPAAAQADERLIDARSGQPWAGELPALLQQAQHLGTESIAEVASGSAPDLALLRSLGCSGSHLVCTSPLDAELLLFVQRERADQARLTVIDLRPLLAEMDEVLSGRRAGSEVDWGDAEWQVLELLSRQPERRSRWLDDLRAIRDIDAFQRALASVTTAPRLAARAMFQGADPAVDLRAELELLGHKLLVGAHAQSLLAGNARAAAALADALESATQPPNQIGVATHLVDLLSDRPPAERRQLAAAVGAEAGRRRSEVLHCFAQWLAGAACGAGAPPWVAAAPAVPPGANAPPPRPPRREAPPPSSTPSTPAAPPASPPITTAGTDQAGDAPHEWTLIQALPNKLVLVAFNEASGRMVPDRAVVGGFSFVARALGPVQDGRFEIEVSNHGASPLRLRHGQYRVRAKLVLDYTREDQCVQGMSCWFSRPELHAKSVPRELVFFMTVGGRFVDRRRADFGSLLPLVADGAARYRSQLKEARLAIESVRFELL